MIDMGIAKELIEKYIDLIEADKFEDLYMHLNSEIHAGESQLIGLVTSILESCDIHPLNYMEYVPTFYNAYREDLTSVIIPDHIFAIDRGAFKFCSNLKSVKLPNTIEVIGTEAFAACIQLETINFSDHLIKIEDRAFFNCASLDNYKLNEELKEIGKQAFWGTKQNTIEIPPSVSIISPTAWGTKKMNFLLHRGAPVLGAYTTGHIEYID